MKEIGNDAMDQVRHPGVDRRPGFGTVDEVGTGQWAVGRRGQALAPVQWEDRVGSRPMMSRLPQPARCSVCTSCNQSGPGPGPRRVQSAEPAREREGEKKPIAVQNLRGGTQRNPVSRWAEWTTPASPTGSGGSSRSGFSGLPSGGE